MKRTMQGEIRTLLGKGAKYEGKLVFEGSTRIDGAFEGSIRGKGILILGPECDVRADIAVQTLIVLGGCIRGEIRANKLVEVHARAVVEADIHAPQLFMEQGARFEGQCSMKEAQIESFKHVDKSNIKQLITG